MSKGRPERATYIGHPMESYERELDRFWVPAFSGSARTSTDGIEAAVEQSASACAEARQRIGVERAFLPADAESALREGLPQARVRRGAASARTPARGQDAAGAGISAQGVRSRRRFDARGHRRRHGPGSTKNELVEALRREEVNRGLTFEYCLITAGTSLNRAPSDQIWREGDILSLNSGGNYKGYIGDLCRMAILGEPDAELEDLLGEVDAIQHGGEKADPSRRARRRRLRRGGGAVRRVAARQFARIRRPRHGPHQPRGAAPHRSRPGALSCPRRRSAAANGMVLSIETTILHPRRGSSSWRTRSRSPKTVAKVSATGRAAGTAAAAGSLGRAKGLIASQPHLSLRGAERRSNPGDRRRPTFRMASAHARRMTATRIPPRRLNGDCLFGWERRWGDC